MTSTAPTIEEHIQTAMARTSDLEREIVDLHTLEDKLAFDELAGDPHAAARAIDLETIIATKERELARTRAGIEEGGRRLAEEQEAQREVDRAATEGERDRLTRVRDEHFQRIEKSVDQLVSAFEDAVQTDNDLAQAERTLGIGHNFAGPRIGMYVGVKLMQARIPVGVPPPPFAVERLGEPLSEARRAKEESKRRRVATQEAEGATA